MTSPVKPWWMHYLEGQPFDGWPEPEFVAKLGITPEGWEPGLTRLRWTPPPWARVPVGWVQGGFLGVPLDMAQSFAITTVAPERTGPVTLDMRISFLETPYSEEFRVEGRVVRAGRRIFHTEGTIHDSEGRLVATAGATNVIRDFPGS